MGVDLRGKELGPGIRQRQDGMYEGRFYNRFDQRKSIYAPSLKELKNKIAVAISDDNKRTNVINENITLTEWYDKWMRVYKIPVIRENSRIRYNDLFESKVKPSLGSVRLTEITKLMITDLFNRLKVQGYSWETINAVKLLLGNLFKCAIEDELLIKNVAKMARNPLNKPKTEIKVLSIEDQADFFRCSAGTFYDNLFVVAVNSGLRPGELFALTEDDLDFKKGEIRVQKTLLYEKFEKDDKKNFHIGPPKTSSSYRNVPINEKCRKALKAQLKQKIIVSRKSPYPDREFKDLLFTTKFDTPINTQIYGDAIKRVVDEINLTRDELEQMDPFFGHVFRHTFATRCFEAGIPPKTVQYYLGHATLQMTMNVYTHVMPDKQQDDMRRLDKLNKNELFEI